MLKLTTKSKVMKDMISITTAIINEFKIEVSPEGLHINAVDNSHVSMVSLDIDKSAFISYDADNSTIGLPGEKFKDVIKTVGTEMSMEYDESKGRLIVRSNNLTRRIAVTDAGSIAEVRIPSLDMKATVKLSTDDVSKAIVASTGVSDTIRLTAEGEIFTMVSGKADGDSTEMVLDKSVLKEITTPDKESTCLPLDYFTTVIKSVPTDEVKIEFATDYPVKVGFSRDGLDGFYLIAPRIESEE